MLWFWVSALYFVPGLAVIVFRHRLSRWYERVVLSRRDTAYTRAVVDFVGPGTVAAVGGFILLLGVQIVLEPVFG